MNILMKRLLASAALSIVTLAAGAQPVEIEGVKLDASAQVGGAALQLNGAGVRTRAFFKVYVAGLYVPQKAGDAGALLAQKGARRIVIAMLRSVDAETFAGALNDGLKVNGSEVHDKELVLKHDDIIEFQGTKMRFVSP